MEKIINIFSDCQSSVGTHQSGIKKLIEIMKNDSPNLLKFILASCVDKILIHPKTTSVVERSIKFICTFACATDESTLKSILLHINSRLNSSNRFVRQRSCQIISTIMKTLTENGAEISCDLIDNITEKLLLRLRDKIPSVRAWAVQAICPLIDLEDNDDKSLEGVVRLMNSDTSSVVRITALEFIPISQPNLIHIVTRMRDINKDVRLSAISVLTKDNRIKYLPNNLKCVVISTGLQDREESCREATKELIFKWMSDLKGDNKIISALRIMGPIENEKETLQLATVLVEEALKRDGDNSFLGNCLRDQSLDWNNGLSALNPADVIWTFVRCSYTQVFTSSIIGFEVMDCLLPNALTMGTLLSELGSSTSNSKKQIFSLKYLLKLCAYLDISDISGINQLLSILTALIQKLSISSELVDPILNLYESISLLNGNNQCNTIKDDFLAICSKLLDFDSKLDENNLEFFEDENDYRLERALKLYHWLIKRSIIKIDVDKLSNEQIEAILPQVLNALQKPFLSLRAIGIDCLGLICIQSLDHCMSYKGILIHAASVEIEDDYVRCHAIQSLVDILCIHKDKISFESEVCNLLGRIQERSEVELKRIACESAAKLLFSGYFSSNISGLFANMLKVFFLSELTSDETDELQITDVNEIISDSDIGSQARLQQLLSIFFKSYVVAKVPNSEKNITDSVPQLIGDMVMLIRDGKISLSSLNKIVKHLLSLCESMEQVDSVEKVNKITSEKTLIVDILKDKLIATLCREMLKLSNSKSDKSILKESVKIMAYLSPNHFTNPYKAKSFKNVLELIQNTHSHDKTSSNTIVGLLEMCDKSTNANNDLTTQDNVQLYREASREFMSLAPGLADLMLLTDNSCHETQFDEDDNIDNISIISNSTSKSKSTNKSTSHGVISDRSSLNRSSKSNAVLKISNQIRSEDKNHGVVTKAFQDFANNLQNETENVVP
eukprot:gene7062-9640_t